MHVSICVCISYAKNVADHTNGPHTTKRKISKNVWRAKGLVYVKDPLTVGVILLYSSFM